MSGSCCIKSEKISLRPYCHDSRIKFQSDAYKKRASETKRESSAPAPQRKSASFRCLSSLCSRRRCAPGATPSHYHSRSVPQCTTVFRHCPIALRSHRRRFRAAKEQRLCVHSVATRVVREGRGIEKSTYRCCGEQRCLAGVPSTSVHVGAVLNENRRNVLVAALSIDEKQRRSKQVDTSYHCCQKQRSLAKGARRQFVDVAFVLEQQLNDRFATALRIRVTHLFLKATRLTIAA